MITLVLLETIKENYMAENDICHLIDICHLSNDICHIDSLYVSSDKYHIMTFKLSKAGRY